MIIHQIHDLTDTKVVDILVNTLSTIDKSLDYAKNYHPDFHDNDGNIFKLLSSGRYAKGKYFVIIDNDEFVCSAGWNEYELDTSIALALTRAYVSPKHRASYHMGNYIVPKIIEETTNYQHLYITSNEYNSAIYKFFVRASSGKSTSVSQDWPEIYKKFKPIGIKNIYYTDQYVAEYQP
jgi:hypothetical protein